MGDEDIDLANTEQQEAFERTAKLVGASIMAFSHVEHSVEATAYTLLTLFGLHPNQAEVVNLNVKMRENAPIALALAHQARVEKGTLERLERSLATATSSLRNRRNRIAHDSWRMSEAGMTKRNTSGTKVAKQPVQLIIPQYEPVNVDEIVSFIRDCEAVIESLGEVRLALIDQLGSEYLRAGIGLPPRPTTVWSRLLRLVGLKREPHVSTLSR